MQWYTRTYLADNAGAPTPVELVKQDYKRVYLLLARTFGSVPSMTTDPNGNTTNGIQPDAGGFRFELWRDRHGPLVCQAWFCIAMSAWSALSLYEVFDDQAELPEGLLNVPRQRVTLPGLSARGAGPALCPELARLARALKVNGLPGVPLSGTPDLSRMFLPSLSPHKREA